MTRLLHGVIGTLCVLAAACSADRDPAVAPSSTTTAMTGSIAPPTMAPVPVESVAMVGDSITEGSTEALERSFATLGLDEVEIDAEGGRRMVLDGMMPSGFAAVSEIADEDPPDLWVIALGTNDVANYAPEEYRPAIAELLSAVPNDAPLVWIDTYLAEYQDLSAIFNGELRAALAERGMATVVDWAGIASEEGVLRDGIHPSGSGIEHFINRVTFAVADWMM